MRVDRGSLPPLALGGSSPAASCRDTITPVLSIGLCMRQVEPESLGDIEFWFVVEDVDVAGAEPDRAGAQ